MEDKIEQASSYGIGDSVGLQKLIDLLDEAKDGTVKSIRVLPGKQKFDIEVYRSSGKPFRISNVDHELLHAPIENGFQYNSKVAVEARKSTPKMIDVWYKITDIPQKSPEQYRNSANVVIDLNGERTAYGIGWYDFDTKKWMLDNKAKVSLMTSDMKWRTI